MAYNTVNSLENIAAASSGTSTSSSSGTQSLGKDEFLKILLAQLKNQDPLKPLDGTEFVAQLAQFSSLEQLLNLNNTLEIQNMNQMTLGYSQSVDMIGKMVVANSGNTVMVNGETVELNFNLAGDAESVTISILDKNGNVVTTWDESARKAGMNSSKWDCSGVEEGVYTYQVSAKDAHGGDVTAQTMITGVVTAVHFRNNQILVTLNGQEIPLSDIIEIKGNG
jgi:flagellar basal-body rod modification protein FlgD